jgi:hypothetical protein
VPAQHSRLMGSGLGHQFFHFYTLFVYSLKIFAVTTSVLPLILEITRHGIYVNTIFYHQFVIENDKYIEKVHIQGLSSSLKLHRETEITAIWEFLCIKLIKTLIICEIFMKNDKFIHKLTANYNIYKRQVAKKQPIAKFNMKKRTISTS